MINRYVYIFIVCFLSFSAMPVNDGLCGIGKQWCSFMVPVNSLNGLPPDEYCSFEDFPKRPSWWAYWMVFLAVHMRRLVWRQCLLVPCLTRSLAKNSKSAIMALDSASSKMLLDFTSRWMMGGNGVHACSIGLLLLRWQCSTLLANPTQSCHLGMPCTMFLAPSHEAIYLNSVSSCPRKQAGLSFHLILAAQELDYVGMAHAAQYIHFLIWIVFEPYNLNSCH